MTGLSIDPSSIRQGGQIGPRRDGKTRGAAPIAWIGAGRPPHCAARTTVRALPFHLLGCESPRHSALRPGGVRHAGAPGAHPPWRSGALVGSPAEEMARVFVWVPLPALTIPWIYVFKNYVLWSRRRPEAGVERA